MKTPNDVMGRQINCSNYEMCPICYGCRNYSSADFNCIKCKTNSKKNICNTKLHKPELIAKLITKSNVVIKDKVEFKSI